MHNFLNISQIFVKWICHVWDCCSQVEHGICFLLPVVNGERSREAKASTDACGRSSGKEFCHRGWLYQVNMDAYVLLMYLAILVLEFSLACYSVITIRRDSLLGSVSLHFLVSDDFFGEAEGDFLCRTGLTWRQNREDQKEEDRSSERSDFKKEKRVSIQ